MNELPYADDLNYWKSSKTGSDKWIEKTVKLIENMGGKVFSESYGKQGDQAAFMIQFTIQDIPFKLVWPVLPTRKDQDTAAKIQAATMLYHDTKSKCLKSLIFGPKTAFFEYLLLPDGRQLTQAADSEFDSLLPDMMKQKLIDK